MLQPVWDVVHGRVDSAAPPAWCERRGWSRFLLSLPDEAVGAAERHGLERAVAQMPAPPASLARLVAEVTRLVEPYRTAPIVARGSGSSHAPLRKRVQVAALLAACEAHFSSAARVVEVGTGRGHVARSLAARFGVPVVGIDSNPALVHRARELPGGDDVLFSVADGEQPLDLAAGDLVVGLHACGALGDALVRQAARGGAELLLVSCCLQKVAASARQPLSSMARQGQLVIPRAALGLTNLAPFAAIGHADAVMRGRLARHALRLLLAERGAAVAPGGEARGIHRRKFRRGLAAVADEALARRGLAPAEPDEIARCTREGAAQFACMRRLSLPRAMLGRVVELAVVLDRATYLEEQGYRSEVRPLFPRASSPRNLAIFASVRASRAG